MSKSLRAKLPSISKSHARVRPRAIPRVEVLEDRKLLTYTFSSINPPGSIVGRVISSRGINEAGQIVGYYNDSSNNSHSYLKDGAGYTTVDAASLGAIGTQAKWINNSGQIVGTYDDASHGVHGFLEDGGVYTAINATSLGVVRQTWIEAINDAGQMVGFYIDGANHYHGLLKDSGGYHTIDPTALGATFTQGEGINNVGQIVGIYLDASNIAHGFLKDGSGYHTIDATSLGATQTYPFGINDAGQIAGKYLDGSGVHGFLIDSAGYHKIEPTPLGALQSEAYGINDAGQIVGDYFGAGGQNLGGFLATPQNPDLAATAPTWNATDGGVDFGYAIGGADLPHPPTVALYWATGTTADTTIGNPIATPTATKTTQGDSESFHVTPAQLGTPPQGAKYLLAVVNPPGADHIPESDDPNDQNDVRSLAVPDISIATATLITPGLVSLNYQIEWPDDTSNPLPQTLEVRLFWSRDKALGSSAVAASDLIVLSSPEDLTPGFHVRMVRLSSPVPSPTHYLLSSVDPSSKLVESDKANDLEWVSPDTGQSTYGVAPQNVRRRLTNRRAWTNEALRRLTEMKNYLGPGYDIHLGSIIKPGEHSTYEKMDVSIRGNTSWEQLALAAARAGFWVHAEGVKLAGKDSPLSKHATGMHLDLYNIQSY